MNFRWVWLTLFVAQVSLALGPHSDWFSRGTVRFGTANLSSGDRQGYELGHGARILQAANVDILMIQEFNVHDPAGDRRAIDRFVEETFGPEFYFYREPRSDYSIPNGIISRFPILKAGSWHDPQTPNRGYAWARIQLSNGQHVYAYSVHFSAKHRAKRIAQAKEMVRLIKKHVPDWKEQLIIIGGDLNTRHLGEKTLQILSEVTGEIILPVGGDQKSGTNRDRTRPYDQILESSNLDERTVAIDLRTSETEEIIEGVNYFSRGLVFDPRSLDGSHGFGDLISDANAKNMQHQLVIKEYDIGVHDSQLIGEACFDAPQLY